MLYETLKHILPYAFLAILEIYGVDLLSNTNLNEYRDGITAVIIALIMQPWIIYHLEH